MAQEVLQQYFHYVNKMSDTARIETVVNSIKDLAYGNMATTWSIFYDVREACRNTVCQLGVPASLLAYYMAFAQQIKKYQGKFSSLTLTQLIQAVKNLWQARGLNNAALIAVAADLGVTVV